MHLAGRLVTRFVGNSSGILYKPCEYNVKEDTGRVDYDQREVALREQPKLIVFGGGSGSDSREWDYKRMREIARAVLY